LKIEPLPDGPSESRRSYRKDRPAERAVVACDSTGHLVSVIEYIGPGLDWLANAQPLSDSFLRWDPPPGPGIWMWEGEIRHSVSYEGERDFELDGTYRLLTVAEAKQSMSGDSPWDPDLWYHEKAS